jgi:threonine dehydratase
MSDRKFRPVASPDKSTVFEYHDLTPPTTADVYRARRTIREFVPHTPLVKSEWLSTEYDVDVYLKREDTLPTGSFKIRGATNLIANLDDHFRDRGVITASTGNYGRAITQAAQWFDTTAIIAVPEDTGQNQIDAIERLGGRVEVVGADYDEAREWAEQHAAEEGYRYAHPGNERLVIAGAGTGGLEIVEARPEVDTVLCPIGAGSVGAGYSLSVGAVTGARVIGRPLRRTLCPAPGGLAVSNHRRTPTHLPRGSAHAFHLPCPSKSCGRTSNRCTQSVNRR